jgi:crotonobetainyl-CoA:carnitine CoA-transferase CaiB-like acyl-CoA transferase
MDLCARDGGHHADWGAEILKVEPINGDPFRWIFTTGASDSVNVLFELDNRGKRSLAIDVSRDEGRELLVELIKDADVFLTNMRPQWLEKCRIDYDTLAAECPRLIYASITGYGSSGEQRDPPELRHRRILGPLGFGVRAHRRGPSATDVARRVR